jgi:SAM-dependent methyltransferase
MLDFGWNITNFTTSRRVSARTSHYASEVFLENINWGKRAFPEVIYLHQDNLPPLDIKDASFEIIYAYSIFTHFEERLHLKWLSELHRLLKPGGLLILTVHGEPILLRCKEEELVRKPMCMEGRTYEEIYHQFMKEGYVFYNCYDPKQLAEGDLIHRCLELRTFRRTI